MQPSVLFGSPLICVIKGVLLAAHLELPKHMLLKSVPGSFLMYLTMPIWSKPMLNTSPSTISALGNSKFLKSESLVRPLASGLLVSFCTKPSPLAGLDPGRPMEEWFCGLLTATVLPVAGLEMEGLVVLLLVAVLMQLPPVGLETDDLMLQVALQDGGDLTLLILCGLDMGDLMTLRGLVRGGEPTVLDSTGLHVAEFLCLMLAIVGTHDAWPTGLLTDEHTGPKHIGGLVVDVTMLLLPPGLEMELEVWGLQDIDEASMAAELTGVSVSVAVHSLGVAPGCWKLNGFNLGLFVDPHFSSKGRPHTGYIFPGLVLPPCWLKGKSASLAAFIYSPMDSATVLESSLESISCL